MMGVRPGSKGALEGGSEKKGLLGGQGGFAWSRVAGDGRLCIWTSRDVGGDELPSLGLLSNPRYL